MTVRHYWFYTLLLIFLDPKNDVIDNKNTFLSLTVPKILMADHLRQKLPWPNAVTKVMWGSDIIDFIFFEFLDPENHVIDKKTPFYSSQFPIYWWPIIYARWPWPNTVTKVTWWSDNIDNIFLGFLDPKNPTLDTEITSLSFLVPEILK